MKKDNRANRYSLKIIDKNGLERTVLIDYNGKIREKMPLSIIDMMTTKYEKEEFKKLLMSMGYDYDLIFIEYRSKGQRKFLDVAYNDKDIIAKESAFREEKALSKKVVKKSENVMLLFYQLIDIQRHNKKLWTYLQNKKYIWSDLTILIANYNYLVDKNNYSYDTLEYQNDIIKLLGNYLVFRKITLGIDEYFEKSHDILSEKVYKKLK